MRMLVRCLHGMLSLPWVSIRLSPLAASSSSAATTTIANPWTSVATADEAAKGAGLQSFTVPNTAKVGGVSYADPQFSYMESLAQAMYESPAAELTIRKSASREGIDLTGDYNDYPFEWTQNIKGLEVTCFGNREGDATKTIWQVEAALEAALYVNCVVLC